MAASLYSQVDSGPGPSLRAPQLPLVGSQEEDGGRDEEQQQQQDSLPGSAAQGHQGHAAGPGGRQAGESDPLEGIKVIRSVRIDAAKQGWYHFIYLAIGSPRLQKYKLSQSSPHGACRLVRIQSRVRSLSAERRERTG